VEKWIEDAKNLRDDDVLLILAGNKADLNEHRQVSTEEAMEYAKKRNLLFFETSARSGANIKVLFNELAKKLTGIDTNPINNVEVKNNNGFSLRGGATG
jgi:GTPase SAR1 family protein